MNDEIKWPKPGDELVHEFRKVPGTVVAEVVAVDKSMGKISLHINGKDYSSVSAAAKAVTGFETNGWVFWGLKKSKSYPRK